MVKQISLQREPLERNREFVRGLGGLEISREGYLFEKIDYSVSAFRKEDPKMTLDKFLSLMTDTSFITLQDDSDPDFGMGIRFHVSMVYDPSDPRKIERFLWYNCAHSSKSLCQVKGLYSKVYGKELDF